MKTFITLGLFLSLVSTQKAFSQYSMNSYAPETHEQSNPTIKVGGVPYFIAADSDQNGIKKYYGLQSSESTEIDEVKISVSPDNNGTLGAAVKLNESGSIVETKLTRQIVTKISYISLEKR